MSYKFGVNYAIKAGKGYYNTNGNIARNPSDATQFVDAAHAGLVLKTLDGHWQQDGRVISWQRNGGMISWQAITLDDEPGDIDVTKRYVIKSGNTYYRREGSVYGSAVYNEADATQFLSKESAEAAFSTMNDFWQKTASVVEISCTGDTITSGDISLLPDKLTYYHNDPATNDDTITSGDTNLLSDMLHTGTPEQNDPATNDDTTQFVLTVFVSGMGAYYLDEQQAWNMDINLAMRFDSHNAANEYRSEHGFTEADIDMLCTGAPEQNDGKDASYYNFPENHEGNPYAMVDHERYPYWVRVAFVELYKATAGHEVIRDLVDISQLCRETNQQAFVYSAMQAVYRYGQEGRNTPVRDLNKAEYYIDQQLQCTNSPDERGSLLVAIDAVRRAQEELT